MDIDTFVKNHEYNKRTVVKWIKEGYIPGADLAANYIPDSARPPYTKARAKNAKAVYSSMVKACQKRQHIFPDLYKMCEEEFYGYIDRLVDAGYIVKRTTDGVEYFDATLLAGSFNAGAFCKIVESVTKAVATGTTEAMLNRMGG